MNSAPQHSNKSAPVGLRWQPNRGLLVFAAIFFPLTVSLGFWQLSRAEEKQALLAEYQAREAAPPSAIASLDLSQNQQYRRVTLAGHARNDFTVLLENRVRHGKPGYEVLTLLKLVPGGQWIWINRGWIEGSLVRKELPSVPPLPELVTLKGHLYRQLEEPFTVGEEIWREAWPQVKQNYNPGFLSSRMNIEFAPYQVRLDRDSTGALLVDWQVVNVIPEKHLGYAVQWFLMAAALVILSVFANTNLGHFFKHRRR
jgi:surfeit locus 1 family protein